MHSKKTNHFYFILCLVTLAIQACNKPKCDDGIQNGLEKGIDCAGGCELCEPTCYDGVRNNQETEIDCGGNCIDVCTTCDDGVKNGTETEIDCGGECMTCVEKLEYDLVGTWHLDSIWYIGEDPANYSSDLYGPYFDSAAHCTDSSICSLTFTKEAGQPNYQYGAITACNPSTSTTWWVEEETYWCTTPHGGYGIFNSHDAHWAIKRKLNGVFAITVSPTKLTLSSNEMWCFYHR
jgi:hypothetical protein